MNEESKENYLGPAPLKEMGRYNMLVRVTFVLFTCYFCSILDSSIYSLVNFYILKQGIVPLHYPFGVP